MRPENKNYIEIKKGITAGVPIVIGYFPVAMAFGLMAKATGVRFLDTALFSVLVFAGASQFAALNLIKAGVASAEIILATLLMNLRHSMMSASLAARLGEKGSRLLPVVAFGITDETFSVSATREENPTIPFLLALNGISYGAWVSGTIAGYLAGAALPASIQVSMGVGLYAMFVSIVVPEMKKSLKISVLAVGAGVLNTTVSYLKLLPSGWSLITSIVLVALAGALLFKEEKEEVGQACEEVEV